MLPKQCPLQRDRILLSPTQFMGEWSGEGGAPRTQFDPSAAQSNERGGTEVRTRYPNTAISAAPALTSRAPAMR
jgi:hypothetical protein